MIELQKIYENYSRDDLEIISLNIDPQEDTALINSYRENLTHYHNISLDWILGHDDPAGTIWYKYRLDDGIPTLCIFDQQGELRFSQEGVSMYSDIPPGYPQDMERLKPLLDTLMGIEDVEGDDFGFRTLNGSVVQLHDYRGKVIILDMWATWCQPCLFQLIELKKAYDYYSRDDLEIFSVNIDSRENNTVVSSFLTDFSRYYQYDLQWIFGQDDAEGTIWSRYSIGGGIPTLCVFDRNGHLQFSHEGVILFNEIPQGYPQDMKLLQPIIEDYLQ
jgi:thiol-disulfide isomerase/thioredoxin